MRGLSNKHNIHDIHFRCTTATGTHRWVLPDSDSVGPDLEHSMLHALVCSWTGDTEWH